MEEALSHVKGDCVAIIEDDDYYAPNYLENMVRALETADLVGLSNNKYYNLNIPGFREMGNFRHSSLCSTALKASILPMLQAAVDSGELYFDVHLWQAAIQNKVHFTLIANSTLCIGIKGMPGRPGVGVGHRNTGYSIDTNLAKLKEWLGNDAAELYMPYIKKVITAPVKQVATPKPAAKAVPQPQARVQQKPLAKLPQQAPTQNKNVDRAQVQQRPMGTVMPPLGTIPPEPQRPPQATTVSYPTGERMQGDVYKP